MYPLLLLRRARRIFGPATIAQAICFLIALSFPARLSHAQDQAAQINTQQDLSQRRQDEELKKRAQFHVTDPELGDINLVSRQQRPKMFSFSTNQSFNYTSNAFLVRNGEQDTVFYNGRFDASFVPYATRNFTPRLTFEHNFFRYDEFSELDFDSQSLQLDLKYDLNRDDTWFLDGSYTAARLESPKSRIGEFYTYGLLNASVTHIRQLGKSPAFLAATLGSNWRQGDPSAFDRVTAYLNLLVSYSPVETVQLGAFVRPEGQLYTNDPLRSSRKDFNISAGTNFSWTPIEYVTLSATALFIGNYSTLGVREYDVFSPNLTLAAQIAF
ncbi:MAG: hypothetical protein ABJB22_03400 [Verrucomicrobiota bacterium]